ncbi:hypothetical protein [Streptomyces coryli]|uniref:hypothetical protein n=1 Tax=Streptomyces coryli TaxID=1128680 RepID=UPI0019CFD17D|nr:hypothetical protein [Streptomyces coryli]
MNTSLIIAVIAVIVVVCVALLVWQRVMGGSRRLRRHFGPEYERTVRRHDGNTRAAEQDLSERLKHHRHLELRDIGEEPRERYAAEWALVQERFVDTPAEAVVKADRLLAEAARDRGFPSDGYEEQVSALSVHHPRQVTAYREVHAVAVRAGEGRAETEELRRALLHGREFLDSLLEPTAHDGHKPRLGRGTGHGTRREHTGEHTGTAAAGDGHGHRHGGGLGQRLTHALSPRRGAAPHGRERGHEHSHNRERGTAT